MSGMIGTAGAPCEQGDLSRRELAELSLSRRSLDVLISSGFQTIGDLTRSSRANLLGLRGFGRKGLNEVLDALGYIGLDIRETAAERLRQQVHDVREDWLRRKQEQRWMPPKDRPSGFLKREVYRLTKELSDSSSSDEAIALIAAVRGRTGRGRAAQSPVYALLAAIVSDEQLQRVEKHRYTDELEGALKRNVPEEYLVGYLLQNGSQK